MRQRAKVWAAAFGVCFCAVGLSNILAQEEDSGGTVSQADYRNEINADRQTIKEQRDVIKEHTTSARQEETQLREQINEAAQSGNIEEAKELKGQLKAAYQENVQQKHQDIQSMHEARQDFRQDVKSAHQKDYAPPKRQPENPPGYNPPGAGPANPAGYNPPGAALKFKDRKENVRDRKEDVLDRRENVSDRREDFHNRGARPNRDAGQGSMVGQGIVGRGQESNSPAGMYKPEKMSCGPDKDRRAEMNKPAGGGAGKGHRSGSSQKGGGGAPKHR